MAETTLSILHGLRVPTLKQQLCCPLRQLIHTPSAQHNALFTLILDGMLQ